MAWLGNAGHGVAGQGSRDRVSFELWRATFVLECDGEVIDCEQLDAWFGIAQRHIGLGDWRPEKSGNYRRLETLVIEAF